MLAPFFTPVLFVHDLLKDLFDSDLQRLLGDLVFPMDGGCYLAQELEDGHLTKSVMALPKRAQAAGVRPIDGGASLLFL